eukprot:3303422-Rhodomonas_salina.1
MPAQINREESIAEKVENENEKTANAVVYTDSQADAEIEEIKKQLRQRDRTFRQSVENERHAEIASSVAASVPLVSIPSPPALSPTQIHEERLCYPIPEVSAHALAGPLSGTCKHSLHAIHEQSMAQMNGKAKPVYDPSKAQKIVEEERGEEVRAAPAGVRWICYGFAVHCASETEMGEEEAAAHRGAPLGAGPDRGLSIALSGNLGFRVQGSGFRVQGSGFR